MQHAYVRPITSFDGITVFLFHAFSLFVFFRAINYDEKDPFLCHACGFCKYAKFDFTLVARPCCAVEPIESDEDRKKTVSSINSLLEKADRVYKQLMANKPTLEVKKNVFLLISC